VRQLEADALDIRVRAERRLGEMMAERPKAVGTRADGPNNPRREDRRREYACNPVRGVTRLRRTGGARDDRRWYAPGRPPGGVLLLTPIRRRMWHANTGNDETGLAGQLGSEEAVRHL
jgi:hypothetical protein